MVLKVLFVTGLSGDFVKNYVKKKMIGRKSVMKLTEKPKDESSKKLL